VTTPTRPTGSPVDPAEPEIVNYVPDEICVVVTTISGGDAPLDEAAFYEHVRGEVNRLLAGILKADEPEPPPTDPLAADLRPAVLRQRFGGQRAPLQPLRRPRPRSAAAQADRGDEPEQAPLTPWLPLRHVVSGTMTRQLYFHLGSQSTVLSRMGEARRRQGLQSVREAVLLLNRVGPATTFEPFAGQYWVITAAAPNWLTLAFPFGCGCPGGLPLPAEPERHRWHFRFRGPLATALQQPERGRVVVAVLDTCPQQADVDAAAKRYPANSLLAAVHASVPMNDPPLVPSAAAAAAHLGGCLPRWQWDVSSGPAHDHPDHFAMPDHGLFVAGIVTDIVWPDTSVHLIRVLNDYGVGDLFSIGHALAALPGRLLGSETPRPDEPRLVVNLSLGIDLPIPARLLERWLPRTAANARALAERLADVSSLLDRLHANLADTVDWLHERGVLVVAATGNDALRADVTRDEPPPPRFPARYDDVLGVAAMRRDGHTPADYSNRGDLSSGSWPGDVATFGGNVVAATAPNTPAVTEADDAVVGIFSRPTLPGGVRNRSGWVRWAGTSFSTPIISGVAARLWAADPTLGPTALMALVRSFAHHPHAGADPDAPLDVPIIDAAQR